jgi:hypothetical protein
MLLRVLCKSGSELSQGGYRLTFLVRVDQAHFHEETDSVESHWDTAAGRARWLVAATAI